MKKILFCLTGLLSVLSSGGQNVGLAPAVDAPRTVEIDGYAAKVNDRVITRKEIHTAMAPLLPELYRSYQGAQLEKELEAAFEKTREQLIERALVMEAFKERGGEIPDQYVDAEIKRVVKARFGGDETLFEKALTEQKKTRKEYKKELREQMAVGMMINEEVGRRVRITPEQIRQEYETRKERYFIPEKVKYSVIILNRGNGEEEQAIKQKEAEAIRKRLLDGEDFNQLAKEVSEGGRAAEGGAFPWMQPKDARKELQEPLRALPVGDISEIIPTETELYILKIEARRQPGFKPFDEVRSIIKAELSEKERNRLKKRWIERLKQKYYVVVYN
jgi:peptidyl-prolyl cis-trans isomerase SurA